MRNPFSWALGVYSEMTQTEQVAIQYLGVFLPILGLADLMDHMLVVHATAWFLIIATFAAAVTDWIRK